MVNSLNDFYIENRPLVDAIIQVESGGDVYASRYEPHYQYLWDVRANAPFRARGRSLPPGFKSPRFVSSNTEFVQQKHSWGPMQVMGAVAREYGFKGRLTELCGERGLHYGLTHLQALSRRLVRAGLESQDDLIAAYNGGWARRNESSGAYLNQGYVDKVNAAIELAAG